MYIDILFCVRYQIISLIATAVAQLVKAFASQAKAWVFESQPRKTLVKQTNKHTNTFTRIWTPLLPMKGRKIQASAQHLIITFMGRYFYCYYIILKHGSSVHMVSPEGLYFTSYDKVGLLRIYAYQDHYAICKQNDNKIGAKLRLNRNRELKEHIQPSE